MRLLPCSLITVALLLPACGDDGPGEDTSGSTSTATTDASSSTGTPPDTSSTSSASGSESGSSGSDGGTSSGSSTGEDTTAGTTEGTSTEGGSGSGGMASFDASMSNLQIFQDCMPIVPPDPVGVSFELTVTNTGDAPIGAVSVVSATFVNGMGMDVGTFDVAPNGFGPIAVGESSGGVMMKIADTLMPPNGCGVVMCNQVYDVELELDVDGTPGTASSSANVDCVF